MAMSFHLEIMTLAVASPESSQRAFLAEVAEWME